MSGFKATIAIGTWALLGAAPASATITIQPASNAQGTLVHNPGTQTTGATVTANLGAGGPNIVNFNADTTGPGDLMRLQQGQGQSDITGAEINPAPPHNDFYNILSGNIYLTGHAGMTWIELGLTPTASGTVSFVLSGLAADGTTPETFNFNNVAIGPGNTHFGFEADFGEVITNLYYSINPLPSGALDYITDIKQVRITQAPVRGGVPEPTTWAMMLLGFGAAGVALRRRKPAVKGISQLA